MGRATSPRGFAVFGMLIPATLIGVIVAAVVQTRVGKDLADDPEYQRRLKAGEIEPPRWHTPFRWGGSKRDQ